MLEHLSGWNGEDYIDLIEKRASVDAKSTRTLVGLNKYMLTDEICERVQQILKEKVTAGELPESANQ